MDTALVDRVLRRISRARADLAWSQPFYGSLMMRLRVFLDRDGTITTTGATDGLSMIFYPPFVEELTDQELIGLIVHEVMHVANGHHLRRNSRVPIVWNYACDFAINPLITAARFKLPKDVLDDPKFANMDAENIYDQLIKDVTIVYVHLPGGVLDQPSAGGGAMGASERSAAEARLRMDVLDAAKAAERAGKTDANIIRLAKEARDSTIDWRDALRAFVSKHGAITGSTWRRPARRGIGAGLLLPSAVRESCPPIGCVIDTSGSINDVALGAFMAEFMAINDEVHPEQLIVGAGGMTIRQTYNVHEGEEVTGIKGGGGTDLQTMVEEFTALHPHVAMLVVLTDLLDSGPWEAPEMPVMWVVYGKAWRYNEPCHPTYGEIVPMNGSS